ncbi:hypothetical protein F5Y15DRAFT_331719 [Xylariaceae sp. FL0016]|nr:hypothetical protein F5Y15DRAFT_331719 [Xylariaceae sp. FL0016]
MACEHEQEEMYLKGTHLRDETKKNEGLLPNGDYSTLLLSGTMMYCFGLDSHGSGLWGRRGFSGKGLDLAGGPCRLLGRSIPLKAYLTARYLIHILSPNSITVLRKYVAWLSLKSVCFDRRYLMQEEAGNSQLTFTQFLRRPIQAMPSPPRSLNPCRSLTWHCHHRLQKAGALFVSLRCSPNLREPREEEGVCDLVVFECGAAKGRHWDSASSAKTQTSDTSLHVQILNRTCA